MARNTISCVYSIINKINNKRYIGQTSYFNARKGNHKLNLRRNQHDNSRLQNSWNKHGEENFIFEITEEIPKLEDGKANKDLLTEKEQYWMDFYESYKTERGYNINPSATSNPMQGRTHTAEARNKISEAAKHRKIKDPILPKYTLSDKLSEVIEQKDYINLFEYKIQTSNGNSYVFNDLSLIDFCSQLSLDKPRIFRALIFGHYYKGITGTITPLNKKAENKLQSLINKNINSRGLYTYNLKDSEGKEYIVTSLNNFCRENKLSIRCMREMINLDKFYKNWSGFKTLN